MPCSGCHLNSDRIKNQCTINASAIISTKFLGRIKSNSINFNSNYLDLIYSTAVKHPLSIPSAPTITIPNSSASKIFDPGEMTNTLEQFSIINASHQQINFYTDGSVIDIGTNQCTMGIGWVQIDNNNQIIHKFSAKIHFWPSSYKAELMSILSAISTAPRNSTINIFTDSQSIITKYSNIYTTLSNPNKLFKFNTWPIWHTLLNIIKSYNLQVTFYKVQAHSDNPYNNLADLLAKQHISSPSLYFNYTNIYNPYHIIYWDQHFKEHPTRSFIKNICKAYILAMWSSQKHNQE